MSPFMNWMPQSHREYIIDYFYLSFSSGWKLVGKPPQAKDTQINCPHATGECHANLAESVPTIGDVNEVLDRLAKQNNDSIEAVIQAHMDVRKPLALTG